MRFRRIFGLNTDPAFVRRTVEDPALVASSERFSVPLTAAEEQEMRLRISISKATQDTVRSYGTDKARDSFAGVYIDQKNGGLVYVAFTKDAQAHMDYLRATFPYPAKLRSFTATYTLAELGDLRDRVRADWKALERDIDINYLALDERENAVVVGVPVPTPAIEQQLRDRYGAAVKVEKGTPATPVQGRPPVRRAPRVRGAGNHGCRNRPGR